VPATEACKYSANFVSERSGRARAGMREGAEIVHRFGEFERADPRTARVTDGWVGPFSSRLGQVPPRVTLPEPAMVR